MLEGIGGGYIDASRKQLDRAKQWVIEKATTEKRKEKKKEKKKEVNDVQYPPDWEVKLSVIKKLILDVCVEVSNCYIFLNYF